MRMWKLLCIGFVLVSSAVSAQSSLPAAQPASQQAQVNPAERAALAALRAVVSAEASFASSCGQGLYAGSLVDLGKPPVGKTDGYLATALSSGASVTKDGYLFTIGSSKGADNSKTSCNGVPLVRGYYVTATPVDGAGPEGRKHFGANATGSIFYAEGPFKVTDESSEGKRLK
jgi:hypothetical protein